MMGSDRVAHGSSRGVNTLLRGRKLRSVLKSTQMQKEGAVMDTAPSLSAVRRLNRLLQRDLHCSGVDNAARGGKNLHAGLTRDELWNVCGGGSRVIPVAGIDRREAVETDGQGGKLQAGGLAAGDGRCPEECIAVVEADGTTELGVTISDHRGKGDVGAAGSDVAGGLQRYRGGREALAAASAERDHHAEEHKGSNAPIEHAPSATTDGRQHQQQRNRDAGPGG
jgi:hypothetical protein